MTPYKKLVALVFEKSADEIQSHVVTKQAKHVVDSVEEQFNFQINERTLRNYYNDLIKNNKLQVNISPAIADHLSKFLGFEDFNEFVFKNKLEREKPKEKKNVKEKAAIGFLIVIASYFGYDSLSYKCMRWTENMRYEKVACETLHAVPIQDDLLYNFKRVEPDCHYAFFKADGSANLWYGKSIHGDYEFFNHLGTHPATGKTLKEVTKYIVRKYICETY